jgi:hypothetical protein
MDKKTYAISFLYGCFCYLYCISLGLPIFSSIIGSVLSVAFAWATIGIGCQWSIK